MQSGTKPGLRSKSKRPCSQIFGCVLGYRTVLERIICSNSGGMDSMAVKSREGSEWKPEQIHATRDSNSNRTEVWRRSK